MRLPAGIWGVLAVLLTAASCTSTTDSSTPSTPIPTTTPTPNHATTTLPRAEDTPRLVVEGAVELPGRPAAIADESGRIWVAGQADPDGAVVYEIVHEGVKAEIAVGLAPSALAVGEGAVWVANASGAGSLYDERERRPKFPRENSVQRIDPEAAAVVASIKIPNPTGLVVAHGSVWVVTPGGGGRDPTVVHRIDPVHNRVAGSFQVRGCCPSIAATGQGIWVLTSPAASNPILSLIDPRSDAVVRQVALSQGSPRMIASGTRTIWVLFTGAQGGLLQIDPEKADPVGEFVELPFPQALAADGGASLGEHRSARCASLLSRGARAGDGSNG